MLKEVEREEDPMLKYMQVSASIIIVYSTQNC